MRCMHCLRWLVAIPVLAALAAVFPLSARAENEGQADLDKATEQRLAAQQLTENLDARTAKPNLAEQEKLTEGACDALTNVIQLCESALKKGLDKGNKAIADGLLASAYTQRGNIEAGKVYRAILTAAGGKPDNRWLTYRRSALADLEQSLKLSPKQPQAEYEIAKLNYLPGGDAEKARAALDKTIEQADDDPPLRAEALIRRAAQRIDPQKRQADLDEAVRTLPGNAMVLAPAARCWPTPENGRRHWPIWTNPSRPTPNRWWRIN